jgi:lipopolysaccharide biosynthesis glycosyltransferase
VRSNFARFSIHRMFPEVGVAWFLDADTLPVADLGPPLRAFVASGKMVGVADHPDGRTLANPPRPEFPWFGSGVDAVYAARYHGAFPWGSTAWNNGVFIADFQKWARLRVEDEAVNLFMVNVAADRAGRRLWRLNTQPIMQFIFAANATYALDRGWNCHPPTAPVPGYCRILHWAGMLTKPWEPGAAPVPRRLWRRYLTRYRELAACSRLLR